MRKAAIRVAEALVKAKRDGYYTNGWYSYIARDDVEELLFATLNKTERAVYRKALEDAAA